MTRIFGIEHNQKVYLSPKKSQSEPKNLNQNFAKVENKTEVIDKTNDNKFSWSEATKNIAKGFVSQGKEMLISIVKNPIAAAGAIGATTALVLAAPLIGISSMAIGTTMATGFLAVGTVKIIQGIKNAVNHYNKGEKDKAEKDFKTIGAGGFDIASIIVPAGLGKASKIIMSSELSNIIKASKLYQKPASIINSASQAIMPAFKSIGRAFKPLTDKYISIINGQFASNLSKSLPAKAINGFHNKVIETSEAFTVKGIKVVNKAINKIFPKAVIGSDFHGKLGSLQALTSHNSNGKNAYINGDVMDKGPQPVTGETSNTRDVIKYINEKLPESKITYGNHEVQVASTRENLAKTNIDLKVKGNKTHVERREAAHNTGKVSTIKTQTGAGIEIMDKEFASEYAKVAKAKYKNLDGMLRKPSTSFGEQVLEPYGIIGDDEIGKTVGQKLIKTYERKIEKLNQGMSLPEGQTVIAESVLKNKNGVWQSRGINLDNPTPEDLIFLRQLAGKELYRHYANNGGDVQKTIQTFSKLYGISDENLTLQKMAIGLKEFNSDFIKLNEKMHMFHIVKGGDKGDILLTHAGIPYYIDDSANTVLSPEAIIQAENMANKGQFSRMLVNKNMSPVYGGEGSGALEAFWFDRSDVTSAKVDDALTTFNNLYKESTGKKGKVSRISLGHETRSNGKMDPSTPDWKPEFEHLLKNTDGVLTEGSENTIKVIDGKERLQRRIVSAYEGKVIFADSAIGDAHDAKLGLLKNGEKINYRPGHGEEVTTATGKAREAKRHRQGAGLEVQRDGAIREVYVRYDSDKNIYKAKPGDFIYEKAVFEQAYNGFNQTLESTPELKQKFETALKNYNETYSTSFCAEEKLKHLTNHYIQGGKAEGKVKTILHKFFPNYYYEINQATPAQYLSQMLKNQSLNASDPTLIQVKVKMPPSHNIDDTMTNLMKNITSTNNGISITGAKQLDGSNASFLIGNSTDHTKSLRATISIEKSNSLF